MISIVIPTHNECCVALVRALAGQASGIRRLAWEIIVADDGSTDKEAVKANCTINDIPHCRYIRREENVGRAMIRNFLAETAQGEWLLYIDGDGQVIADDYLKRFLQAAKTCEVCYGGYRMMPGPDGNLRWLYEKTSAPRHVAERRREHPYRSFNISNLLIKRNLMLTHPLDSRFTKYGYEDVLLGKQLQLGQIDIAHIDAPIGFFDYEDNAHFVAKTEEGLRTLARFHDELRGYSALLEASDRMNNIARTAFRALYRMMKHKWRSNLCGTSPSLLVFKLYKLGYFLTLMSAKK